MGNQNILITLIVCLGIALISCFTPSGFVYKYKQAISECEKNLPREKHCKVIGVVDEDKGE